MSPAYSEKETYGRWKWSLEYLERKTYGKWRWSPQQSEKRKTSREEDLPT